MPMSSPMMKRMFGFCCCAAAGMLVSPVIDNDISVVAPRNVAVTRLCQPVFFLGETLAPARGLFLRMQSNMVTLRLQCCHAFCLTHGKPTSNSRESPLLIQIKQDNHR